ncbi:hypothetical protein LTR08_002062 [Meristemomyces frigidus]|nr:hypothetical protein LTR08_002062 [Meristemomyces frigidus]
MSATVVDWSRVLDDADAETAALMIKLQLEDARDFAAEQATAGNYHALDAVVACEAHAIELQMYRDLRGLAILEKPDTVDDPTTTGTGEPVLFMCAACNDSKGADDVNQVPCQHYYCDTCLSDLFRAATVDESLYPPRCCRQDIPYEDISRYLPGELRTLFEGKREELDDKNRLYCRVPTCSAYIGNATRDSDKGTCPTCAAQTCHD